MTLSLDSIQLGSADSQRARDFYASALQASDAVRVGDFDEGPSGYQGYTVSYIVEQPTEVRAVLDGAEQAGAVMVKPAKKMLFGAFAASREEAESILRKAESAGGGAVSDTRFTDPDGYLWSVVAI